MCPNRQIISLYHDGELPSPWKEKMEAHLESCPECRTVLSGYGRIGESLKAGSPETLMAAAQERVWKKLTAPELATPTEAQKGSDRRSAGSPPESHQIRWAGKRAWNLPPRPEKAEVPLRCRNVTLPLPVAAAAVLLIVVSFVLIGITGVTRASPQDSMAAVSIGLDEQGILPIQDITEVLHYLSSQDNGDFMVIRLPESRKFSRTGEPALINAADYSRRTIYR